MWTMFLVILHEEYEIKVGLCYHSKLYPFITY